MVREPFTLAHFEAGLRKAYTRNGIEVVVELNNDFNRKLCPTYILD